MAGGAAQVVVPRYGSRSLAELLPSVLSRLAPDDVGGRDTLGLHGLARRVVVLVVDGLGADQLRGGAATAPTLHALPGDDLDSVFPTTTVTALGSIGTGRPPGGHGLAGYAVPLPDHRHPLNLLTWRIGPRGEGFDARAREVPEALQPRPTVLEAAAAAGIEVTVVVDPAFLDSGLTRAALRGGSRRAGSGLDATLATAVEAVASANGPGLAYAHHGAVDETGHEHGPRSQQWRDALADVDRAVTALAGTLPPDVEVLVTADHGMLEVPEPDVLELSQRPGLLDGVRVVAGEPRVRQLAVADGATPAEVAARWRAALGDRATVATREEAEPWFGGYDAPRLLVGDVVVVSHHGTLAHCRVDPHEGRQRGQHGGTSRAERLVPLRRMRAAPS